MQVAVPGVTQRCTPYTDYVSARLVTKKKAWIEKKNASGGSKRNRGNRGSGGRGKGKKDKDKNNKDSKDKPAASEPKDKLAFLAVKKLSKPHSFIMKTPTALSALSTKLDLVNDWIFDYACNYYISSQRHLFIDSTLRPIQSENMTGIGSKGPRPVAEGTVVLRCLINGQYRSVPFKNVFYTPGSNANLLSMSQIQSTGASIEVKDYSFSFGFGSSDNTLITHKCGDLFPLDIDTKWPGLNFSHSSSSFLTLSQTPDVALKAHTKTSVEVESI